MAETKLVGILNLTPDSFSDGGKLQKMEDIWRAASGMISAGASVLDVGAESTRPGATPLTPEEEWERLAPFFAEVFPEVCGQAEVSIDTRHPETAAKAIAEGAHWINDVSGFESEAMLAAVAKSRAKLVVMHSLTVPADPKVVMKETGEALVQAVLDFAEARIAEMEKAGISRSRILFDPGIGFGKNAEQSLTLLKHIDKLKNLEVPLYIGHSRKSFLKAFAGPQDQLRDAATLVCSSVLIRHGVDYLRVHDVAAHRAMMNLVEELG